MDEIGNMSASFQERILRVVEYQEFERVGGRAAIRVDVRIISATNANLEELMRDGLFRRDLYDRLTFSTIDLPPLRRRREEIPHLVVHFVGALHEEMPGLPRKRFQSETVEAMMDYYWPGNVRELRNMVERLYLYSAGDTIVPSDLPPEVTGTKIIGDTFHERVEQFRKQLIMTALIEAGNNQREAARGLGMTYDQFRYYYRKYSGTTPGENVTGGEDQPIH
jgi:DNA-binding NtrC family response regulator